MKTLIASVTAVLAILPLTANAGSQESHGGIAVVCRDASQKITSAELLDVFEAELYHLTIPVSREDSATQVQNALRRVDYSSDAWAHLGRLEIEKTLTLVRRDFNEVQPTTGLQLIDDALPVLRKKGGPNETCGFEQLGAYLNDGYLRVDQEIWDKLDDTSRTAFYLHEAIYKIARMHHVVSNSVAARKSVVYLLAQDVTPQDREAALFAAIQPYSGKPLVPQANSPEAYEFLDFLLAGKKVHCSGAQGDGSGVYDVAFQVTRNMTSGFSIQTQETYNGDPTDLLGNGPELQLSFDGDKLRLSYADDGSYTLTISSGVLYWLPGEDAQHTPGYNKGELDSQWDEAHTITPLTCELVD